MATIDSIRNDSILDADEVAEIAKVSRETVLRWGRNGDLPCIKLGPRIVRFRTADVLAFLNLAA